jgi:predicted DNA-binding transcriptional regulator YafY
MRADRLLSILLLLRTERRVTTGELAQRLSVSPRTIHRDMDALSGAGVPVVAERGAGGGWYLLTEYRTNLTGLSTEELQALFVATPARLFTDLGLSSAAAGARIKLRAALPQLQRPAAEDVRQRIHIDVAGWRQAEGALPAMPVLQAALWGEHQVTIRYRRADDSETERTIDPLGLVAKGSLWYLIAAVVGEIRTYRVSRIVTATMLKTPAERPAGFDLAAYWAASSRDFLSTVPQYRATVRTVPEVVRTLRNGGRFARIEAESAPDADGWITLQICFDGEQMARESVLGFGTRLVVEEPSALREYVIREAAGIVARYGSAEIVPAATTDDGETDKKEPPDRRQQPGGNEEGGWRVSRHR